MNTCECCRTQLTSAEIKEGIGMCFTCSREEELQNKLDNQMEADEAKADLIRKYGSDENGNNN